MQRKQREPFQVFLNFSPTMRQSRQLYSTSTTMWLRYFLERISQTLIITKFCCLCSCSLRRLSDKEILTYSQYAVIEARNIRPRTYQKDIPANNYSLVDFNTQNVFPLSSFLETGHFARLTLLRITVCRLLFNIDEDINRAICSSSLFRSQPYICLIGHAYKRRCSLFLLDIENKKSLTAD